MTDTAPVLLVDLSSIGHPIWHMSQAEPDPDYTSQRTAAIGCGSWRLTIRTRRSAAIRHPRSARSSTLPTRRTVRAQRPRCIIRST